LTTVFEGFEVFEDAFVALVVDIVLVVWATAGAAMTASAVIDAINAFIGFLLLFIRRVGGASADSEFGLSGLWLKGYMLFMRERREIVGAIVGLS
jgi:hypothetical protein